MTRWDDLKRIAAKETDDCILWPYGLCVGYAWLGRHYGHRAVCHWANGPAPTLEEQP